MEEVELVDPRSVRRVVRAPQRGRAASRGPLKSAAAAGGDESVGIARGPVFFYRAAGRRGRIACPRADEMNENAIPARKLMLFFNFVQQLTNERKWIEMKMKYTSENRLLNAQSGFYNCLW